jgi:HD superfamily phosphohydrolase
MRNEGEREQPQLPTGHNETADGEEPVGPGSERAIKPKREHEPPETPGEANAQRGDKDQAAVAPGTVLVDLPAEVVNREELAKETLLPVSGMVRLTSREMEIIDHPAFQRLFEIFQLGQTYVVYRGATHMRGEHAVGSVAAVMEMVEALERNRARGRLDLTEHWQTGPDLSDDEIAFVRLGALVHDIGHLAAGHTLEDELGLLPRHDGDDRINLILDRMEWHGRSYLSLRSVVDSSYAAEAIAARQVGNDGGELTASELLVRLISSDQQAESATDTDFRVGVCRDLIGNTICADLLDYLHRDWLHLGKPRHFDPRLLDYLEIRSRRHPSTGKKEDRLVINLRGGRRPRPDAVTAILELLESRYQLSEIALFHRTKLSAAGVLERVIAEYRDTFPDAEARRDALGDLTSELLECTDAEMLKLFERKLLERREDGDTVRIDGAVDLARRLRVRQLHRDLCIFYEDDVGGPARAALIASRFSGDPNLSGEEARSELQRAANDRLDALRTLEGDFALNSGDIVMYCPPLAMNVKIADVGIYLNGHVDSLAALDESDRRISGGHLRAQQERFRRLWRVSFSIDRDAYERLEQRKMLRLLLSTIEHAVLRIPPQYGTEEEFVQEIADAMTKLEASPWFERKLVQPALHRGRPTLVYPGGVPSIRAFIAE